MKVNIGIEISDEQRNKIARRVFGATGKRMVTRLELRSIVDGFVNALADNVTTLPADAEDETRIAYRAAEGVLSNSPYTAAEQAEAERLTNDGRNADYIRGWIGAGRVLARAKR